MPSEPSNQSSQTTDLFTGSVSRLALLFHQSLDEIGNFQAAQPGELPEPEQVLLAHNGHMTVALEAFHNSLVDVHVLAEWSDEASYAREILLSRQSDGAVVQYGIMRVWLADLPPAARDDLHGKGLPLGRVLIRHNVLRDVELMTLWQIAPSETLRGHVGAAEGAFLFGRTAQILVQERPTVQLLEIVKS